MLLTKKRKRDKASSAFFFHDNTLTAQMPLYII